MTDAAKVEQTIHAFLERSKKGDVEFTRDTDLYEDGIGLDSLATAELSATLEDELGSDPFSAGDLPQTVGDIIDFYAAAG
jgi:acyl carrier protein